MKHDPKKILFGPAGAEDEARIMEIIRQAQRRMKERGSDQWQNGYPASEDIGRDIALGRGYTLRLDGRTVAYGAADFGGEPAYDDIRGAWLSDAPYVVVHRLAVADEALRCGMASLFMLRTEELAHRRGVTSFRVDTNFDNEGMLRLLDRLGFVRCGEVTYPRSGDRIVFEKLLA